MPVTGSYSSESSVASDSLLTLSDVPLVNGVEQLFKIDCSSQLLHDDVIVPSLVTATVAGNGSQACDDRDGVCDNSHVIDDHLVESTGGASLDEVPLAGEELGAIVNLVVEHEDSSIHEASCTSSNCLLIGEFQFFGEVHGADMLEGSLPHEELSSYDY
ncbi:hypothetical protein V6N11_065885 [Hibiscus sabdariffa]|uniref:Uncharacterized protein n=1 Tax=Hibiscus sabdariffa TaxID=183260 RepID=A0ABR2PJB2_9ROSI